MTRSNLAHRLANLEAQRQRRPHYVVRYELDGVRYAGSPDAPDARPVPADEDLGDATLILVRYSDAP